MNKKYLSIFLLLSFLLLACTTQEIKTQPAFSLQQQIQYTFHKQDILLIDQINKAQSTLDIAIYSLTKPNIITSIYEAKKRGVEVRILTDHIQASGKSQKSALRRLSESNIPIKIEKHSGLMHLKMTIVDKKIATTGSFNYSTNAVEKNDEVLVVIEDEKIAQEWSKEFDSMWSNPEKYVDWRYE